jgi:4-aminobutyrate--pyruvate transaminase
MGRHETNAARDIAGLIHPYTNLDRHTQTGPIVITRGDGAYVEDDQGRRYLEAMSGLWCTSLGFSEQRLVDAAHRQMQALPYYQIFASRSTEPAIELSERLLALTREFGFDKALFANSGSEANDAAVKLAWYYFNATGKPKKKKLIGRVRGYHGVTVMTASLAGIPSLHADFDLPVPGILQADCPSRYFYGQPGETDAQFVDRIVGNLEALIAREGADTIAAFFAEPVQGAGGVIVPTPGYWEKVQQVLKKHDILLVADEVICGFGRTGNWWGSQTFGMQPDIMTMAKQLSAAHLPIAAVLINQRVYEALRENSAKIGVFAHGITYSGHPTCAAVALETLKIYEERKIVDQVRALSPVFLEELNSFADHPLVGECRGVGLIGAIELVKNKATHESFDPKLAVGATTIKHGHDHGVILRPVLDSICFCPPLICSEAEIRDMFARFRKALADTRAWLKREGHIA